MLRTRRSRREEPLGPTVPEPIVSSYDGVDPEHQALLADSVGLALLVVLELLRPQERSRSCCTTCSGCLSSEIAPIVGRRPRRPARMASRARRRVRGEAPPADPDLGHQQAVLEAFLAAARGGDFGALLEVLDPDVVSRVHTVEGDRRWAPPAVGAENVARRALARGRPFAPYGRPAIVNGQMGAVADIDGRRFAVVAMTISDGRIATIDVFLEPRSPSDSSA